MNKYFSKLIGGILLFSLWNTPVFSMKTEQQKLLEELDKLKENHERCKKQLNDLLNKEEEEWRKKRAPLEDELREIEAAEAFSRSESAVLTHDVLLILHQMGERKTELKSSLEEMERRALASKEGRRAGSSGLGSDERLIEALEHEIPRIEREIIRLQSQLREMETSL